MEDLGKFIFEECFRRLTCSLTDKTALESFKYLGEFEHLSELAKQDIPNALRYLEEKVDKTIKKRMDRIIRSILKPQDKEAEEKNEDLLKEYFPNYLPLKEVGKKVLYREALVFFLMMACNARAATLDRSNREADDFFAKDLSFLLNRSAIRAPNPKMQESFNISFVGTLQEGLAGSSLSKKEISEYVLEHFSVDLSQSKLLEALLDGHFQSEWDFYLHLGRLIETSQQDPNLLRLLENNLAHGQKALGFNHHFSFISHSHIPTGQGPSQYIHIPPKMVVYVAAVPGSLTTREEGFRRVDEELLKEGVLHYSSIYRGGTSCPNFIMSFDNLEGYPLQRIELTFKNGQKQVVRRPCKYSSRFRLSDVICQILAAYPHEWIDISLLGCMAFEREDIKDLSDTQDRRQTMYQIPSSVMAIFVPLKFTSGATHKKAEHNLGQLVELFGVDRSSAIFGELQNLLRILDIEVGSEICDFNVNKLNAKDYEEYIESQVALNPFDTRVRESTWLAVCACLENQKTTNEQPLTLDQQQEFCQAWGFDQAYLPLMPSMIKFHQITI